MDDPGYIKIRSEFAEPNIFRLLRINNYEIRHSQFLSWLLDPGETHGQGHDFLDLVIKMTGHYLPTKNEKVKVYREKWYIDILIESPKWVLAVENKIKSTDFNDQLYRYRQKLNEKYPDHTKVLLYLTPTGASASDCDEHPYWSNINYNSILSALYEFVENNTLSEKSNIYIRDYISCLEIDVLNESMFSEIANSIINDYKTSLNKIFDAASNLNPVDRATVEFIRRNSTYSRGVGFFSADKPYVGAFEATCRKYGFYIFERGPKQTTYFSFLSNDLMSAIRQRCEEPPVSFTVRFWENSSQFSLNFGLAPRSERNTDMWQLVYNNLSDYQSKFPDAVSHKTQKRHISIGSIKIHFDSILSSDQEAVEAINNIFKDKIANFVAEREKWVFDLIERNNIRL